MDTHQLRQEIKKKLYQRKIEANEFPIAVQVSTEPITPEQLVKSSYNFEFANLPEGYSERDLERCLVDNVEKLLLEFDRPFVLLSQPLAICFAGQAITFMAKCYCYNVMGRFPPI